MSIGEVLEWSDEKMIGDRENVEFQVEFPKNSRPMRIVTDAAGSLTREDARSLGIELPVSYVLTGTDCIPETLAQRSEIYEDLKNGRTVTTSQASAFEMGQNLERIASAGEPSLYLFVGSVYTGNYRAAPEWKKNNDPRDRLTVVDTWAASGRLACMAMATAEFADKAESAADVVRFAGKIEGRVEEYIFPEKLRYLARSGRLSKTSAFFGDMVGLMPVVCPTAEGAKTMGAAISAKARLAFAIEKLKKARQNGGFSLVLLEFSDNRDWVEEVVKKRITETDEAAVYRRSKVPKPRNYPSTYDCSGPRIIFAGFQALGSFRYPLAFCLHDYRVNDRERGTFFRMDVVKVIERTVRNLPPGPAAELLKSLKSRWYEYPKKRYDFETWHHIVDTLISRVAECPDQNASWRLEYPDLLVAEAAKRKDVARLNRRRQARAWLKSCGKKYRLVQDGFSALGYKTLEQLCEEHDGFATVRSPSEEEQLRIDLLCEEGGFHGGPGVAGWAETPF